MNGFVFWSEPIQVGDVYVGGGELNGRESAAVFGEGWHCHLTADEATRLAAVLLDITRGDEEIAARSARPATVIKTKSEPVGNLDQLRKLAGGLQLTQDGQDENPITREVVERTIERFVGAQAVDDHVAQHRCGCPCVGNGQISPDVESHHSLLALHGLRTRYVTGALLASRRKLQRRQWVRRAGPAARPSDTTTGGDAA